MVITDHRGANIRFPDERWRHICADHPEMTPLYQAVCDTIAGPEVIANSSSDPAAVKLYHKWYADTSVGGKWLRVVIKFLNGDAFVLTAYLTNDTD